ncbi:MAG TPA: cupin domain-containing protein [Propionibacteriaceae bacterium]|nr:cupin domain-containing protein [Propionibacteriaceae bacterium]
MMSPVSIASIAEELRGAARANSSRRAARTVVGDQGHQVRQTVIALSQDAAMGEHEAPGEGTLYVMEGKIELSTGTATLRLGAGDLAEIPRERHSVRAVTDAVVLLTAMPREFETPVSSNTPGAR